MEKENRFYSVLTLVFTLLICCCGAGYASLASGDETRVAGISAEMLFENRWLIPHLNGKPFLEYPGLYYYLQAFFAAIFGLKEFAVILASTLAAAASALLIYPFARKLEFSPGAAFLSAVFFLTGAQVFEYTHKGMVDMLLAFFVEAALFSFYSLVRKEKAIFYFPLFILAVAGGIMTKGLLGAVLPCAVCGVFLLIRDILEKKTSFMLWGFLIGGAILGWFPWLIWVAMIYAREGFQAFYEAAWVNNFGRFTGTQGDHCEPVWYYFQKLPALFQPWLIFLLIALVSTFRELKKSASIRKIFLLTAILLPFLIFSAASAKRQVYLLPIYAYAALLTGDWFDTILKKDFFSRHLSKIQIAAAILFSMTGMFFLYIFCGKDLFWPVLLLVSSVMIFFFKKKRTFLISAAIVLFYTCVLILMEQISCASNNLRPLFIRAEALEKEGYTLVLYKPGERIKGAACFYLKRRLPECDQIPTKGKNLLIVRDRKCWNQYAGRKKMRTSFKEILKHQSRQEAVIKTNSILAGAIYADHHLLVTPEEYRN